MMAATSVARIANLRGRGTSGVVHLTHFDQDSGVTGIACTPSVAEARLTYLDEDTEITCKLCRQIEASEIKQVTREISEARAR